MFLDEERNLYNQFDLPRTMKTVWSIQSVIRYAEFVCSEREFYKPEVNDDPHQLAGDFIINHKGIIEFIHRSKSQLDRPSIEALLSTLVDL